jgi:hypothetical protein
LVTCRPCFCCPAAAPGRRVTGCRCQLGGRCPGQGPGWATLPLKGDSDHALRFQRMLLGYITFTSCYVICIYIMIICSDTIREYAMIPVKISTKQMSVILSYDIDLTITAAIVTVTGICATGASACNWHSCQVPWLSEESSGTGTESLQHSVCQY